MSKTKTIISGLALVAAMSLAALAQTPSTKPASKPATPAAKHAMPAKKHTAQKTDAEIQSCVEQKLAAAPKLKDQGFSVSVSGGVATFTGAAKNASSKGGVNGIAKACGAKQVVNNITVQAPAKPAASSPAKRKTQPAPKTGKP